MDRRIFLQSLSVASFWSGLTGRSLPGIGRIGRGRSSGRPSAGEHQGRPSDRPAAEGRKAIIISLLPKDGSYAQRFKIARDAGFDAIEMQTIAREDEAAEIRDAAMKSAGDGQLAGASGSTRVSGTMNVAIIALNNSCCACWLSCHIANDA